VPALEIAEKSFHSSLQFDPDNRTANQRLGMIAMYRQDFESAVGYLEEAHDQAPDHRGIIKLLGYSYIWFGKIDMGQSLLSQIPEARDELNVYIWWWGTQGRNDLSENASLAWEKLSLVTSQP
jgi:tetratricopeptide (TPR) repeat protein